MKTYVTTGVLARICITFIRGVADICSVVAMKENEATDEQF